MDKERAGIQSVEVGFSLVEALAQAAALLTFSEEAVHDENTLYYFVRLY